MRGAILDAVRRGRIARPPDRRSRDHPDLGQGEQVGVRVLSGQWLGLEDVRHNETGIGEGAVPVPISPMEIDLSSLLLLEHNGGAIKVTALDQEATLFRDRKERRHPREREQASWTEDSRDFPKRRSDVLDESERVSGERDVKGPFVQYGKILGVRLEETDAGLLGTCEGAGMSELCLREINGRDVGSHRREMDRRLTAPARDFEDILPEDGLSQDTQFALRRHRRPPKARRLRAPRGDPPGTPCSKRSSCRDWLS